MNDHVCLAYSSSTALLLLLPRQGSQRLGLPASGEPQVVFCRAFAGETRKEEAEVDVDVDVDVLSHGNALTAGAHPGNLESGPLKNYGYLVSIPPKELPPFALLCLSSADCSTQLLSAHSLLFFSPPTLAAGFKLQGLDDNV
ncbi:hypothetical protein TGAM01_v201587 [Trichoderma gamsii]|uniref:Uncharacterized protein n=1 Tax=Trichoderma gamsii TaxID=398673 RepID=A0A2P4ZYK8_9HYPO|nr:hypothetical protein TGAM01_v201587 [Trichoderma gamsii]PON29338.1 hypothetical protein TGAM01_v201587 [Trichoderma gamsii]